MQLVDPAEIAEKYLSELKDSVLRINRNLNVIGFIASEDRPSISYAKATKRMFSDVGFDYELRQIKRLDLESEILQANEDPAVHGIFVYFPVFGNQEDDYLRNLVHFTKDIEAGSRYWTRKLTDNDRHATPDDDGKKALLPCTPLAIVKILDDIGEYGTQPNPLSSRTVTIFNRSEVIGRPLAVMMSNDGAKVYSFDEHGPLEFNQGEPSETTTNRSEALRASDIVITGVPHHSFQKITPQEINREVVAINFSSLENFTPEVAEQTRVFVPRVGPMTVAMCMRNTIRLFENFHLK
jgi:methylenetetrahydrofolate dehydrogenase (NAD+)